MRVLSLLPSSSPSMTMEKRQGTAVFGSGEARISPFFSHQSETQQEEERERERERGRKRHFSRKEEIKGGGDFPPLLLLQCRILFYGPLPSRSQERRGT